jgi:hypothetical protein
MTSQVDTHRDLHVLNPSAERFGDPARGLAPRPASLAHRTVGLLWNGKANGDVALRTVGEHLEQTVPDVTVRFYSGAVPCDTALLEQVGKECDVVVACTADCGSCTSWITHDCVQLERVGVPAVVMVSAGFEINLAASARAFGLPELQSIRVPIVYNNVAEEAARAETHSLLEPLIRLLTTAAGDTASEETAPNERLLRLPAAAPTDAMATFQAYLDGHDWGDGYPLWPPTPDRVAALVDAVGADRDEVLFQLPPGNGETTVEKLAVNCAMAGCTPAEMVVVEAILRTFTDEQQRTMIRACLMSTSAHAPVVVVNGPLARQLEINGGRSCLGPGRQNQVNIRISRAVNLSLKNLGRWSSGVMDLDTIGTPRKHIVVVAENEEESPWSALHTDQGFAPDDNVVTLFFSLGEWDVGVQGHLDAEQLARALGSFSGGSSGTGYFAALFGDLETSPVGRLMLMAPAHASALDEGGLTKSRVRDILFESGTEPVSRLVEPIRKLHRDGKIRPQWKWVFELDPTEQERTRLPVIERSEDYHIVVAGSARGKDLLMPTRCSPVPRPVRADWLAATTTRELP